MRLFLDLAFLKLELEDKFANLFGIARGPMDFVMVLLQGLNPASNVGGMLAGIVREAEACRDEITGQVGSEFLFGIFSSAKFGYQFTVQPVRVACPVAEFM